MEHSFSNSKTSQISFKDFIKNINNVISYLKYKIVSILIVGFIGGLLGFVYAYTSPLKYIAKLTFVVEESRVSGGGLSALAGQFGFDLGGGSGGNIFAGDNILLFLKSENLCREVLLTYYDDAKQKTLADKYSEVKKLKNKWKSNGKINFKKYQSGQMPIIEDSLLQVLITKYLLKNDLLITKPDKKASFVQIVVTTEDEKLSQFLSQRLVKIAVEKYIESKMKLRIANVAMLEKRADSLSSILNDKTYKAASNQQVLVDANPAIKTSSINSEISNREKSMIATIFAEVVKNLEIAKSILNQETPSIQIVDHSYLPLEHKKLGKFKTAFISAFIFSILYISGILFRRWMLIQLTLS